MDPITTITDAATEAAATAEGTILTDAPETGGVMTELNPDVPSDLPAAPGEPTPRKGRKGGSKKKAAAEGGDTPAEPTAPATKLKKPKVKAAAFGLIYLLKNASKHTGGAHDETTRFQIVGDEITKKCVVRAHRVIRDAAGKEVKRGEFTVPVADLMAP